VTLGLKLIRVLQRLIFDHGTHTMLCSSFSGVEKVECGDSRRSSSAPKYWIESKRLIVPAQTCIYSVYFGADSKPPTSGTVAHTIGMAT
jgi:hypothetical protein